MAWCRFLYSIKPCISSEAECYVSYWYHRFGAFAAEFLAGGRELGIHPSRQESDTQTITAFNSVRQTRE